MVRDLPILLYGVVKGMPFLIGLGVLVVLARRREHAALTEVLSDEVGRPGLLAPELALLGNPKARREARKRIRQGAGPEAERRFRDLQKEQVKLALIASAADSADDARIHQQRAQVQWQRANLWLIPGVTRTLGIPADEAARNTPAAVAFNPNTAVGSSGAWAWATPDQADKHRVPLSPALPLQIVEQRGEWALVRAAAGWHGWTGMPYLTPER